MSHINLKFVGFIERKIQLIHLYEKFVCVFVRGKAVNRKIKAGYTNFGGDFRMIAFCA
jgi:hypothetical protein